MRFPKYFLRDKGGGTNPALGGDSAPTTAVPSEGALDNLLESRVVSPSGSGIATRLVVAVGYTGADSTPGNLQGDVYIWEEVTGRWYVANASPVTLPANGVAYFSIPVVTEQPTRSADLLVGRTGTGSVETILVVSDPGSGSDGTYSFALGYVF